MLHSIYYWIDPLFIVHVTFNNHIVCIGRPCNTSDVIASCCWDTINTWESYSYPTKTNIELRN